MIDGSKYYKEDTLFAQTSENMSISTLIAEGAKLMCLNGMYMTHTKCINSTEKGDLRQIETIDLSQGQSSVTIYGNDALIMNSTLIIRSNRSNVHDMATLTFVNVTFEHTLLILYNVVLIMEQCKLNRTQIHDLASQEKGNHGHVHVKFTRSIFMCDEKTNNKPLNNSIQFGPSSILKVSISETKIAFCRIELSTGGLMLQITNSSMLETSLQVNAKTYFRMPSIITFTQTYFTHNKALREEYPITLNLYNPDIAIDNCIFDRYSLKIISVTPVGFQQYYFHVQIRDTQFLDSHQVGSGGALFISSDIQSSAVHLSSVIFIGNKVVKPYGSNLGSGGAAFIEGSSVILIVENSRFVNNFAPELGSALFTSRGVTITMKNSSFHMDIGQGYPKSIFLFSGGVNTLSANVNIEKTFTNQEAKRFDVATIGRVSGTIDLTVNCPQWFTHGLEYKLQPQNTQEPVHIVRRMRYIVHQCGVCSDGYYTTAGRQKLWYFSADDISDAAEINGSLTDLSILEDTQQSSDVCIPCPYGSQCSYGHVRPRPNYWGYWHEGELVFKQCPPGYCCLGRSPCNEYNSCADNRTGILCGACQEGFSVSILTGQCLPDSKCGKDQWFWAIALLATIAYALWYSLKDDIVSLIFIVLHHIRHCCNSQNVLKADEQHVDKGYFGILIYFVQMSAIIRIQIEFSDIDKSESFLDTIGNLFGQFLNMELTQIEIQVCPTIGMTTMSKTVFKLAFLFGIYLSWLAIFLINFAILRILQENTKMKKHYKFFQAFHLKLVRGIVETIKYTYAGFCSVLFTSVVCVQIGCKYVWWYDGTNQCLENWQIWIVVFGLFYALPLPLVLLMGMKQLKYNHISAATFICCCLCPLVSLFFLLVHRCSQQRKSNSSSAPLPVASEAIISVLQGPYNADEHLTLYWEAMVSVRRLLITAITLISYASIRMTIITMASLLFLCQHIFMKPFLVCTSNYAEALSLLLLSSVSVINLLKASLTDSGVIPTGPSVPFFKTLELFEKMSALILLLYIVFVEIKTQLSKYRNKKTP